MGSGKQDHPGRRQRQPAAPPALHRAEGGGPALAVRKAPGQGLRDAAEYGKNQLPF